MASTILQMFQLHHSCIFFAIKLKNQMLTIFFLLSQEKLKYTYT